MAGLGSVQFGDLLTAASVSGSPSPGSEGSWVSPVLSVLGIWVLCALVPQPSGKVFLVYVLSGFFSLCRHKIYIYKIEILLYRDYF